ncbi:LCP family protein [bacterium]|nr:LCP family protein [bacterium]
MTPGMRKRKPVRKNRYQKQNLAARGRNHDADDDFMAVADIPAWRSLIRFAILGLMVAGAIYLTAISINVLILGTDDVDYAKHTDTIMLVHWRPLPRRLALLSVPRDTLIKMPKRGPMKINAVYAYGNALGTREYALAMTRAAIETLLGLKIHYVVHVRYSNFIHLVDAIGGIPLYVEKKMRYTDQAGGVNINLEPGYQLLDGRQCLNYVRFRHDREGDIGRIRRQQKFVKAFVSQLVRFTKVPRTINAFVAFFKQVETNMSMPAALFLAVEIKGIAQGSWRQAILPGEGVYIKGKSFWKPDLPRLRKVVADLGKPPRKITQAVKSNKKNKKQPVDETVVIVLEPTPKPTLKPTPEKVLGPLPRGKQPLIRVLNGCGVPGVAGRITQRLMESNIQVKEENTTNAPSFDFPYTIIKSKPNHLPWAERIATILGLDEGRVQVIPKNVNYPTVTIVIGGDYQELIK